jgi:hypothetical protein
VADLAVIGAQHGGFFGLNYRRAVVNALGSGGRNRATVAALGAVVALEAIGPILTVEAWALVAAAPVVAKAIVARTAELAV